MIKFIHPTIRTETGAVQFGEEWPGIFIRGVEALALADTLRSFNRLTPEARSIILGDLIDVLESCRVAQC